MTTITTITSRKLNQDVGSATKAAKKGPVFITHRGKPNLVLLDILEYQRMTQKRRSVVDALAMDGDVDFEPVKLDFDLKTPDFA